MTEITKKEVEHIADLARVELTKQELEIFQKQLSSVLDYMKILEQVKTEQVKATAHVIGLNGVMRNDLMTDCKCQKDILKQVPITEGRSVKVKAVFKK
ncbi:Asp-tRNA(Asn)/Glu-tRNA(Gln) amidotransferase subunit GatC [Patescibacteria group bacterium]|nr:Asp-tRNA(Asn)/Glu-tRNA(Gln) amidotransferase subunit GatC [Patescibacteria group bacterium]MBU1890318.1 Asp-tRNA(Asn)/Glu-tRNA(Gln) amidotransferase subunit GatC [Patescibacteria group bacterium]